jgi:hypothetical protein
MGVSGIGDWAKFGRLNPIQWTATAIANARRIVAMILGFLNIINLRGSKQLVQLDAAEAIAVSPAIDSHDRETPKRLRFGDAVSPILTRFGLI